jgi:hypothetical protein
VRCAVNRTGSAHDSERVTVKEEDRVVLQGGTTNVRLSRLRQDLRLRRDGREGSAWASPDDLRFSPSL